jgi:3-oxoadipate enol-lactonase
LIIAGAQDTVTLPEHSEQLRAAIPGAQLLTLPSVHLSNVEYPDEFMKALTAFLDGAAV